MRVARARRSAVTSVKRPQSEEQRVIVVVAVAAVPFSSSFFSGVVLKLLQHGCGARFFIGQGIYFSPRAHLCVCVGGEI